MLEILILWHMCKSMRRVVGPHQRVGRYQLMLVAMWFAGEFGGGILGAIVGYFLGLGGPDGGPLVYLFALAGAGLSTWGAFKIARAATKPEPELIRTGGFSVIPSPNPAAPGNPELPPASDSSGCAESDDSGPDGL